MADDRQDVEDEDPDDGPHSRDVSAYIDKVLPLLAIVAEREDVTQVEAILVWVLIALLLANSAKR